MISDKIREWCDETDVDGGACDELGTLADRIRKLAKKEDK